MIRVCFITPYAESLFFPELPPSHGGAETQFYLFARQLATHADFDVHAIVRGPVTRAAEIREGVTVHTQSFVPGLSDKLRLQKFLGRIDADVYLQRAVGSVTKELAFFCLYRQRKFVFWIGSNLDVDTAINREMITANFGFEWGMRRAHRIIAQTRHQARRLKACHDRTALIIPNAFPPRPRPAGPRAAIVWIGRCAPVKRPDLFVNLARAIPEERFLMIAPVAAGPSRALYDELAPRIAETANLEYRAGAALAEIDQVLDAAKLLVNTSDSEGYPNTFVQAMWSATPIASLRCDPDGMIAAHELGIAPRTDLPAFGDAIMEFLRDPATSRRAGEAARAYGEEHHSLPVNADRLGAELKELIR